MDIDELRRRLEARLKAGSVPEVCSGGSLKSNNDEEVPYEVAMGWDLLAAHDCDQLWRVFNLELLAYVQENFSGEEQNKVLATLSLEDFNWEWQKKSMLLKTDEYVWFFLKAEGVPQAACLIHHPKHSQIDQSDIFYIEFIAVAPWNRDNPYKGRRFRGLGRILVDAALDHSVNTLGLVHGFSLHSLPKAEPFYKALGMQPFPAADKDTLAYYEMPRETAKGLLEASL